MDKEKSKKTGFLASIRYRFNNYSRQEKILLPIFHVILLLFAIYMILPLFFGLMNSFKSVQEYDVSAIALPSVFHFENYSRAFQMTYRNNTILQMFFNSVIFTITFAFGNIFSSLCTAYALSKFRFFGRNFLYTLAIVVQIIPIFGTGGAAYILMDNLGLVDNIWLLWISGAGGFDYTFLIVFSYLENVDRTYSEAAKIDGAGNFTIMFKIIVPMVIPAILVMSLSATINLWNDYTTALMYLPNHPTLSTGLYGLQSSARFVEGGLTTYFAGLMVAIIPIMLLFIFVQKTIFKIDVSGGVKG